MAKEPNRVEHMLEADGLRVRYFDAGSGNPIIVFLAKDGRLADPILGKLVESHRIISLNLSSHEVSASQLAEKLPGAVTRLGIERGSVIGVAAGARPAVALAIGASERIDRLILLSPELPTDSAELPEFSAVKAATLVLIGTSNSPAATEAGRLCREKIPSCHLSFVYGTGDEPARNLEAWLDPIIQFLEEGEQFIIFRQSQLIRPEE